MRIRFRTYLPKTYAAITHAVTTKNATIETATVIVMSIRYLHTPCLDEGAQEGREDVGNGNRSRTQDSHSGPGWHATGRIGVRDVLEQKRTRRWQRDNARRQKERNVLNQIPKGKLHHRDVG